MKHMKKLKLRELEDRLYWLNDATEFFKDGYDRYLLKKYTDAEDYNVPLMGVTLVCLGDEDSTEESNYAHEMYNYVSKNHIWLEDQCNAFEPITKIREYRRLYKTCVKYYVKYLIEERTLKKDIPQFEKNKKAYKSFYKELEL